MKKPNGCTMSANAINQKSKVFFWCSAERRPRSLWCLYFEKSPAKTAYPVCWHALSNTCECDAAILDFIKSSGGAAGIADSFAALVKTEIERKIEAIKGDTGGDETFENEEKK